MNWIAPCLVIVMLLIPSGEEQPNPWKDKVPAALAAVDRSPSISAYRKALDVTWRADDWSAALKLACAAAEKYPKEPSLRGRIARALWRAGEIHEAERVGATIAHDTRDPIALTTLIQIHLARGESERANAAADRLEKVGPATATELYYLLAVRLDQDRLAGMATALREAERRVDPDNGYPEIYLAEALKGLPDFFAAIGAEPINQITGHGAGNMPMIMPFRLPYCPAMINGQGPYRLILDTGGSITLSLDDDVARELKLKSFGTASIRGISGTQESGQTLVDDLRIGEIVCRRVMTRTFALPELIELAADGIIGTGVFARARMTLDFEHARLSISASSEQPASGEPAELRIVGDAKLVAPLVLQGESALGLLDSGADVAAVSPRRLKKLFPDRELAPLPTDGLGVGEGAEAGISLAPGVDLEFGGRTYENYSGIGLEVLDSLLSPILGIQTDVLIGMPVFRDMKSFTVDFPRRRMWVEWLEESPGGDQ